MPRSASDQLGQQLGKVDLQQAVGRSTQRQRLPVLAMPTHQHRGATTTQRVKGHTQARPELGTTRRLPEHPQHLQQFAGFHA
jgi:hypothetical protein